MKKTVFLSVIVLSSLSIKAQNVNLNNSTDFIRVQKAGETGFTRAFGLNGSNQLYIGSVEKTIGNIFFYNKGANYLMTLNPNGNIGIGTTDPKAKLEVIGNLNTSDHINANQYISVSKGGSYRVAMNGQGDGYISGRNDQVQGKFLIHSKGNSFLNGGNLGIGTANPDSRLHIWDDNTDLSILKLQNNAWVCNQKTAIEFWNGRLKNHPTSRIVSKMDGCGQHGEALLFETQTAGETSTSTKMIIKNNGNIGIGTNNPDSKLTVNGKIHAKEVKVDLIGWPDYVFEDSYKLPTLKEVEKHIEEKGHLQNIPSAKKVKKEGIQLGEMNAKLLQKIEELTLYIIEQNKKTEQLQKEVALLKEKVK